jgi:hypothetical protein
MPYKNAAGFTGGKRPNGGRVINPQVGTSYTLLPSDNGKTVVLTNASAITLNVPTGLGASYNVRIIQGGAGQVTVTPVSTTVSNRQSHTKTAGANAKI